MENDLKKFIRYHKVSLGYISIIVTAILILEITRWHT